MDKTERVNLVTNILQGAYTAALVEHHNMPPREIDDDFNDLCLETQSFLMSLQGDIFRSLDVTAEDFAIEIPPDVFIFDE